MKYNLVVPEERPSFLEPFDMLPKSSSAKHKRSDVKHYLDINEKGWTYNVPMMQSPTINQSTNKQIPLRNGIDDVIRRAKINGGKTKFLGTFPQTGGFRNELPGLASLQEFRPVTIMPLPDSFYPALNTTLV